MAHVWAFMDTYEVQQKPRDEFEISDIAVTAGEIVLADFGQIK